MRLRQYHAAKDRFTIASLIDETHGFMGFRGARLLHTRVSNQGGDAQINGTTAAAVDDMTLNLPQNWDSLEQQRILDGLPALIFLERAGRIVFANAEARNMMGSAE